LLREELLKAGKEASPATSRQSGRLKKEKYPLSGDNKQREALNLHKEREERHCRWLKW